MATLVLCVPSLHLGEVVSKELDGCFLVGSCTEVAVWISECLSIFAKIWILQKPVFVEDAV